MFRGISLFIISSFSLLYISGAGAGGKSTTLLKGVESKYKQAKTVSMNVSKTVKMKVLEREKKSQGSIQIKKGGRLKWETNSPDHSLIVASDNKIWLVSYPNDPDEKINVIKAVNPRHSQPHAVVAFLMGQGRIGDDFAVVTEKPLAEGLSEIHLKPRQDVDQIQWLTLVVNNGTQEIERVSFEDSAENVTELQFTQIKFNEPIENKVFKFSPPKNADVTLVK